MVYTRALFNHFDETNLGFWTYMLHCRITQIIEVKLALVINGEICMQLKEEAMHVLFLLILNPIGDFFLRKRSQAILLLIGFRRNWHLQNNTSLIHPININWKKQSFWYISFLLNFPEMILDFRVVILRLLLIQYQESSWLVWSVTFYMVTLPNYLIIHVPML